MQHLVINAFTLLTARQNHEKCFGFPKTPEVSTECQNLLQQLVREKEDRLCSKRYQINNYTQANGSRSTDVFGSHVFADDAEDIKAHRWFKDIAWDRLPTIRPPFVPHITYAKDTHYFDESEAIEEWSGSGDSNTTISPEEVRTVLRDFRASLQDTAIELVSSPYDSVRLQRVNDEIDHSRELVTREKDVLKQFIRFYHRKERKRPRDLLLRDSEIKDTVMDIRKRTAFIGYTWQRMRPRGYITSNGQ